MTAGMSTKRALLRASKGNGLEESPFLLAWLKLGGRTGGAGARLMLAAGAGVGRFVSVSVRGGVAKRAGCVSAGASR